MLFKSLTHIGISIKSRTLIIHSGIFSRVPTHSCGAAQFFGMGSINTGLGSQFGGLKLHLVAKMLLL